MKNTRRGFLKTVLTASAVGVAGVATASASSSNTYSSSNGVIRGKSPKKEITYFKTQAWEDFYKSAL